VTPPLVSIVTTSYNQERYLEETLRSVLEQDYPRIEYLVIDDGSTDGSVDIIHRYAASLAWWRVQENQGQPAAANAAAAHASGDVLAFVNSDDTLLPGAVSGVAAEFERDAGLALVYGDVLLTNERSERLEYQAAKDWDVARMARDVYTVSHPASFWARWAWERAGPLNERSWALFDIELGLRVATFGRARHLQVALATFRLHPESKTMSRHLRMADECLRFAREFYGDPSLPRELRPYARRGRATLHRRAALYLAAAGERDRARREFLRSVTLSPRGASRKQLRRLAPTLVPGRRG
jgi:glycosyltransferase involved in cell wall biosynthesis